MPGWIVTCIIVVIFSLVMVPLEKWIYKKISNKHFAWLVTFAVASVLMIGIVYLAVSYGAWPDKKIEFCK